MVYTRKILYLVFWFCALVMQPCVAQDPVEFFVLICSYNNAKWYQKNLDSVFSQTYPHWHIYYVDDCSPDGTGALVKEYIEEKGFTDKCTVICNTTNKRASANYYYAIQQCDPHKVVVNIDGDDWLAHDKVLELLASVYSDPNIWMTWGSYKSDPSHIRRSPAAPFPKRVVQERSFRKHRWVLSHLRTYYAALFQKIPMEEFMLHGEFMKAAHDVAFMFPLIEMASNGHFKFIKEVLYVYNCSNPLSDFRRAQALQREVGRHVTSKPPYPALDKLF